MTHTYRRWTVLFSVLCILTASWAAVSAANDDGVTFASEHVRLTAYFQNEKVHIVMSDGMEIELPQQPAASGARYAEGETEFWNKGDSATLQLDGQTHDVRIVDSERDPWERARRGGVDFRGVGQEPGWFVQIREEFQVELSLNYGTTDIVTPLSSKEVDYVYNTVTYRTASPLSPLPIQIVVEQGACYDAMSGEGFTHSVTVQIGEENEYVGCGRYLQ